MYTIKDNVLIGLSKEEVEERIKKGQVNKKENRKTKSYGEIFKNNVLSIFNGIILVMAIIVSFTIESISDISNLSFVLVAFANLVIGIIQEIKAKKIVDKLVLSSQEPVKVLRNLDIEEVNPEELVLDDIIFLDAGRAIPADAVLIDGEVYCNESAITGESDDIVKKKGDEMYSGSFIVSGECHAKLIHVGKDNFIEKLSSEATKYSKPKSEIMSSLNKLISAISIALVPISLVLFWIYFEYSENPETISLLFIRIPKSLDRSVLLQTVTSINGMIPYGLFLLTSVSLAASVIKLARTNTIVQELYCIEQLARVDTICLDKTGTITDGSMSVVGMIQYTDEYYPLEIISSMNGTLKGANMTTKALIDKYGKKVFYSASNILNFTSQNKFSAVTFSEIGTFALGAPDILLKLRKGSKIYKEIESNAQQGLRVLALCRTSSKISAGTLEGPFELVALITLQDNIRAGAKETLKEFHDNGVDIRIISGDNPITVSAIAKKAGVPEAEKYVSLAGMSDDEVIYAAKEYKIFGRVKPNQKKLLVETLKKEGHKVAMTGDGVNDILALRESDCSIVMATGSEAVKTVAHIVLLDSNFLSLPKVVGEGRRVINNIERSASLFLSKTFMMMAINVIAILLYFINPSLKFTSPFTEPSQLFIIETFITGIPSLVLALEPNALRISGVFLRNVFKKAIPSALIVVSVVLIVSMLAPKIGVSEGSLPNLLILLSSFTFVLILLYISMPFSKLRIVVCSISGVLCLSSPLIAFWTYSQYGVDFFHFTLKESGFIVYDFKSYLLTFVLLGLAASMFGGLYYLQLRKRQNKEDNPNETRELQD